MSEPKASRACEANGRTHEPNLRELTGQLDDLKELLLHTDRSTRELMEERDRRYEERFAGQKEAVSSALTAQKELTTSAFASSEKAIVKAEDSQRTYNAGHNDLSRKMESQYKDMLPRPEATALLASIEDKIENLKKEIAGLRESRSEGGGERHGRISQQQFIMMIVSLIVALVIIGGAVVSVVYAIQK